MKKKLGLQMFFPPKCLRPSRSWVTDQIHKLFLAMLVHTTNYTATQT